MSDNLKDAVSEEARPSVPALRIVHLRGGLRAVDLNAPKVRIEVCPEVQLGSFTTPNYDQLYRVLAQFGFESVGVDFFTNVADAEYAPPDWQVFHPDLGVYAMTAERSWAGVKHAASKAKNAELGILASKANTYLRLLPLRIRQLSEAYNSCLTRALTGGSRVKVGNHFQNEWSQHIDAAIHAFLSDAGAFRDVLAETVWRVVLGKHDDLVTSLGGLLKRTKSERHPLITAIREAAESGWLFQLSDLRNHIVHVAPVADTQEHHACELRARPSPSGMEVPMLHVPLVQADGHIRKPSSTFVDYGDRHSVLASIAAYRDYVEISRDALEVCEEYLVKLVALSQQIKKAAGLQERELVITRDDIIGEIEFY